MSEPNVCPHCQKASNSLLSDPVMQMHAQTPIAEIGKKRLKFAALLPSSPEALQTFNFLIPGLIGGLGLLAFPVMADILLQGTFSGPTEKVAASLDQMAHSGLFPKLFYVHTALTLSLAIYKHFTNIRIDKDNAWSGLHKPEIDKLRVHAGHFRACLSCKTLWNADEKIFKPFPMTEDSLRAAVCGGEQLAAFEARAIIAEIEPAADSKPEIESEPLSCIRPTSTTQRL